PVLLADEQSLAAVGGIQHHVAAPAKDGASEDAHLVLVLDQEDRLAAALGHDLAGPRGGGCLGDVAEPGQVHLERRPLTGLAVDPDVPSALLDNPEDRREAEARTLALLLG